MKKFLFPLSLLLTLSACAFNETGEEDGGTDGGVTIIDAGSGGDVSDGGNTSDDTGDNDTTTDGGDVPSDSLGATTEGKGTEVDIIVIAPPGLTILDVRSDFTEVSEGGIDWEEEAVGTAVFRSTRVVLDGRHRVNVKFSDGTFWCGYMSCDDPTPVTRKDAQVYIRKDGQFLKLTCEPEVAECVGNGICDVPSD